MHAIVFGGLGPVEEKVFNALVNDYIEGFPPTTFTFVTTSDKSTACMLAEKLAATVGIACISADGLIDGIPDVVSKYPHPAVMLAVHDEDPEMLPVLDLCRAYHLDPMDLCIGLIPLLELMGLQQ